MWETLKDLLFYHRPAKVTSLPVQTKYSKPSTLSFSKTTPDGIPEKLSFLKIVNRETCFPCRLDDFMNYLTYVERNAENLRFYLWIQQYTQRFDARSEEEKALAPAWESPLIRDTTKSSAAAADHMPTDVYRQPFREEVDRVTQMFLVPTSQYELNLSGRDRTEVLSAVAVTTHPSAFKPILPQIESSLRQQSHPNFIRHALSTSSSTRVAILRWGGLALIIMALGFAIALSLGRLNKGLRVALPSILFFIGMCGVMDAQRSVCLVLMAFGGRDRLSWESHLDYTRTAATSEVAIEGDIEKASIVTSFDIFDGPIPRDQGCSSGAVCTKPAKQSLLSHILVGWEKTGRIDPEIRRLQRLIVLQNLVVTTLTTAVMIVILAVTPSGNLY